MELLSLERQSGRRKEDGVLRSIPVSPGCPRQSAEGAIPQEITSGCQAATRGEFGDGGAVPVPAPQGWQVTLQSPPSSLPTFPVT